MIGKSSNKGDKVGIIAVFILGFVMCVGGLYVFLKSDETAYSKTQQDVIQFRGEMKSQVLELSGLIKILTKSNQDFAAKCDQSFEELKDADSRLHNSVGAMELEIKRIKEKQNKLEVRAIPTTHTVKIEMVKPMPVQIIQRAKGAGKINLLERSGIKKVKAKDH